MSCLTLDSHPYSFISLYLDICFYCFQALFISDYNLSFHRDLDLVRLEFYSKYYSWLRARKSRPKSRIARGAHFGLGRLLALTFSEV